MSARTCSVASTSRATRRTTGALPTRSINTRVDVNAADREYGYCYDETCGTRVHEYEAGTLILDFVDTRTNRVVWRGWAQDAVQGMLESRDVMARKIDEAVTRMLEQFPKGL
jgi:hypothetical protein